MPLGGNLVTTIGRGGEVGGTKPRVSARLAGQVMAATLPVQGVLPQTKRIARAIGRIIARLDQRGVW